MHVLSMVNHKVIKVNSRLVAQFLHFVSACSPCTYGIVVLLSHSLKAHYLVVLFEARHQISSSYSDSDYSYLHLTGNLLWSNKYTMRYSDLVIPQLSRCFIAQIQLNAPKEVMRVKKIL